MRRHKLLFVIGLLVPVNVMGHKPSSAGNEAAAMALPRTEAKLRSGEPVRIVCFGDSVTGVYYHTGGRRAYTDMLGIALTRDFPDADLTMINAGISGHSTVNALARIDADVLQHQPTLVTVMFGLNDMAGLPRDQYGDNLRTIVDKCRASGAEVLLCTPNNVIDTPSRPIEKLAQFCETVRDVGRRSDVPVCDCYGELECLRSRDAVAWRLLMSDEIHPNMDGHQRIAELLARSITGREIRLADVPPPAHALAKTFELVKSGKPVRVLAMPPLDELIFPALKEVVPDARLEITPWVTAGKTLHEIEQDAKARVRPLKPDLVMIAVPRTAKFDSLESFIGSYTWIMNWSLSFARQEWDCVVAHPSLFDPDHADRQHDALIRQLVSAQDLTLIDRPEDDRATAGEILVKWLKQQRQIRTQINPNPP